MQPLYQVRKVSNEGTASPFISRLFNGILELRNNLVLINTDSLQKQTLNAYFDKQFKPMFEAAEATRDSAIQVCKLVEKHFDEIQNGKAVKFRPNQYDILETIDKPLSQAVDLLIDQSIIATKTGLQNILKDPLNLDIGFFFQKDTEFLKGINDLLSSGENDLARYLKEVRDNWHSELQNLRRKHEHEGWSLDRVEYRLSTESSVIPIFPMVLGMPVFEFVLKTANRVLFFIENMLVYAMLRYSNYKSFFVVDIPIEYRDPSNPLRFRLAHKAIDQSNPWVITYKDIREFV